MQNVSEMNADALLNIKEIHMSQMVVDQNVPIMLNAHEIELACVINALILALERVEIWPYAKL